MSNEKSMFTISQDASEGMSAAAVATLKRHAQRRSNIRVKGNGVAKRGKAIQDNASESESEFAMAADTDTEEPDAEGVMHCPSSEVKSSNCSIPSSLKRRRSSSPLSKAYPYAKRTNIEHDYAEFHHIGQPYQVINRVSCSTHQDHIFLNFMDTPTRGSMGHLNGFQPIRSIEEFRSQNPQLGFLVIKDHYCRESHDENYWNTVSRAPSADLSPTGSHFSANGRIRVVHADLQATLNSLAGSYIYDLENDPKPREMRPPYIWIYHHLSALKQRARQARDLESYYISCLLNFVWQSYGREYQKADQHYDSSMVDKNTIHYLFRPNQVIVTKSGSLDKKPAYRAFVLASWPRPAEGGLYLDCWYYDHNGAHAGRKTFQVFVSYPLDSTIRIDQLTAYPLEFAEPKVRELLVSRGKEYWEYKDPRHICYDGWDDKEEIELNEARMMVDYRTYRQIHPESSQWNERTFVTIFDPWPQKLSHDAKLQDEVYAIFPPTLHAFMFKDKQWMRIRIERICPIVWNKQAFERMVLAPATKDLIKSLVLVRTSEPGKKKGLSIAGRRKDMIAGKGNGLIMLLHGGPGTGKTLTAEGVAEVAEKPLYNVTCGDIGTNAGDVEEYLTSVLFLGKRWNCVLLLDEAEVFLEERSLSDLQRNSLVSVFLRTLEYYDGILILTTNRVGTFDEAFSSRIQISVHFPNLDRIARTAIWLNFLAMLREDEEDVNYAELESHVEGLSDIEMNGRQIRNTLTTARQLAMYKSVTLEWEHLERAVKSASVFTKYIQTVHGHTNDQWARDEKLR